MGSSLGGHFGRVGVRWSLLALMGEKQVGGS